MKRSIRWAWLVFLSGIVIAVLPPAWTANSAAPATAVKTVRAGYLENVVFERLPGKERVTLELSKQSGVAVEKRPGNVVLIRLKNILVPEELRRALGDKAMANILRVTPAPKADEDLSWPVAIELKQMVPYNVRQQGMNILVDFNVTSVAGAGLSPASDKTETQEQPAAAPPAPPSAEKPETAGPASSEADEGKAKKTYTGTKISLDVQEADIKAVFRLLSEVGKVSIVAGDDVKGTVTLTLKEVPWDEALDTILRIKGVDKTQVGNVITVMSLENLAKQKALEKSRRDVEPQVTKVIRINYANAAGLKENLQEFLKDKDGKPRGSVRVDDHSNALIIQAVPEDIRRITPIIEEIDKQTSQILIKANIVETTKDFARNLGIQWGGVFGRYMGNQSLYVTPGGTGGSTIPPGSALDGSYTPLTGAKGVSGQGYAANFPAAAISGTNPASLGLLFGTIGGNILDVQLSALQKDGKLNILSSPSISTLDNQKASTENGMEVPITTRDKDGNPSTSYKLATLKLEITPHVIDGRTLKMTITVQKDEVSSERDGYGNPWIIKKLTTTSLIVQDGETIVISGLTKQNVEGGDTGIPLFKDIPVLGWLFKTESKTSKMEEVLIFITPNILKPQAVAGIQDGPESGDRQPASAVR